MSEHTPYTVYTRKYTNQIRINQFPFSACACQPATEIISINANVIEARARAHDAHVLIALDFDE